jgi:alpha-galactosidase
MVRPSTLILALTSTALALNNGVGKLPHMGFDTFNAFVCDYDEQKVLAMARAMKDSGLLEAGYRGILLDDCMTTRNRTGNGKLAIGMWRI